MKLPNRELALVAEAKITLYFLNLESVNGKTKAVFFRAFGFSPEKWQEMALALKQHANSQEVSDIIEKPPFGVHYVIEGPIETPDGRNPEIRVIWIIDTDSDLPRLVSAYPL
jgi:hypothetical protein